MSVCVCVYASGCLLCRHLSAATNMHLTALNSTRIGATCNMVHAILQVGCELRK